MSKTHATVKARLRAKRDIDEAAGAARSEYTTVVAGQDRVYRDKLQEAVDYLANGGAVPPYVAIEVDVTGATATVAAQAIVNAAAACRARDVVIEAARLAGKRAVDDAGDDVQAIESARDGAVSDVLAA